MGHGVIDVALLAEARTAIGTGHVIEALAIADALGARDVRSALVVPADAPAALLERATVSVERVPSFAPPTLAAAGRALRARGARLALTNLRAISNEQVRALAAAGLAVVCVDELGDRQLDCLAVINASPVAERHRYASDVAGFRTYGGPQYLALDPGYARRRTATRELAGPLRSILVTMGGVDRTRATLRIVDALAGWRPDVERHVVVGAGADWAGELQRLVAAGRERWRVHRQLPSLADLIATSDVGITAGGNTLLEMACLGTPAVVLHEDPHEADQGRALAAAGFGLWVGAGTEAPPAAIRAALDRLDDAGVRRAHAAAGRRLVDGLGAARIAAVVVEYLAGAPEAAAKSAVRGSA